MSILSVWSGWMDSVPLSSVPNRKIVSSAHTRQLNHRDAMHLELSVSTAASLKRSKMRREKNRYKCSRAEMKERQLWAVLWCCSRWKYSCAAVSCVVPLSPPLLCISDGAPAGLPMHCSSPGDAAIPPCVSVSLLTVFTTSKTLGC